MNNVLPFDKTTPKRQDDLERNVRRAVLLLDISLDQTAQIIDARVPGYTKHELQSRMQGLRDELDLLRLIARNLFAGLEQACIPEAKLAPLLPKLSALKGNQISDWLSEAAKNVSKSSTDP